MTSSCNQATTTVATTTVQSITSAPAGAIVFNENTYFVNTAVLNEGANFRIDWNYTTEDITFRITASTTGWVGFGLSPNGGMFNSDIILAWTNSAGGVEFKDAHVESSTTVLYDSVQNWEKLYYSRLNGVTTVIFKRKNIICNPDQPSNEINIDVSPSSYVIYAWGNNFNNGLPAYHQNNRGSRSLPLLAALNQKVVLNMNEVETADFRVNVRIQI